MEYKTGVGVPLSIKCERAGQPRRRTVAVNSRDQSPSTQVTRQDSRRQPNSDIVGNQCIGLSVACDGVVVVNGCRLYYNSRGESRNGCSWGDSQIAVDDSNASVCNCLCSQYPETCSCSEILTVTECGKNEREDEFEENSHDTHEESSHRS